MNLDTNLTAFTPILTEFQSPVENGGLATLPKLSLSAKESKELTELAAKKTFVVEKIRRDFPILQEKVNGKDLIWFDNAATTHKPQIVIDRISYYYAHENSNVHRAAHELAARSTDAYELAREKVRHFINAASAEEIIFVRGTTEGINLVAKSWGEQNLNEGDEIIVRPKSTDNEYFKQLADIASAANQPALSWIKSDVKKKTIQITGLPKREEAEPDINEQLIVEYYSR